MDRLEVKTADQRLRREFINGYGYPPKIASALLETVKEHIETNYRGRIKEGQLVYQAIAKDEPPGKPLEDCSLVSVKLTLFQRSDLEAMKKGMKELRKQKILRLATEAEEQKALLTQEDLAVLLTSSSRTTRDDIAELRRQGIGVPTRGYKIDIGRGTSHKARIVGLWLKGYEYYEIEVKTGHSPRSISRYIEAFKRVVLLHENTGIEEIRQITGLTERVLREYLQLLEEHRDTRRVKNIRSVQIPGKKGGMS